MTQKNARRTITDGGKGKERSSNSDPIAMPKEGERQFNETEYKSKVDECIFPGSRFPEQIEGIEYEEETEKKNQLS